MASKQTRRSNAAMQHEVDDFTLIRGIGPVLAGRLDEAGIRTISQMASLSPAELAARIDGLSVKQITRKDLIGQARKLAHQKVRSKPHQERQETPTIRQHYENFTIEFLLDEKNTVRRSRAVHIQSGDADTWVGWESNQLIDFLAQHMETRIPAAKLTHQEILEFPRQSSESAIDEFGFADVKESSTVSQLPTVIKLAHPGNKVAESDSQFQEVINLKGILRVHDLKVVAIGSEIPLSSLHHEQPYLLQLTLDLTEVEASSDAPLIYKATIVAKQLGGFGHLVNETISTLKLSDNMILGIVGPILPPGIYRLAVFVTLTSDEAASHLSAFLKGDLLQVY